MEVDYFVLNDAQPVQEALASYLGRILNLQMRGEGFP